MLSNNNGNATFLSYKEISQIPYMVIEALIKDKSEQANRFWKLLKHEDINALDCITVTESERKKLIWKPTIDKLKIGHSENDKKIFLKPLLGDSTDSSTEQTQIRMYRSTISPTNSISAIVCFEVCFFTNEKQSLVYDDDILCERTDLMESIFIDLMNGRDIGLGSSFLVFDRELTRSCNSQLDIGNSKTFYGRSLVMALNFVGSERGCDCG